MEIELETARHLWAVRYGYAWLCYGLSVENSIPTDPTWLGILTKLRENACFDINYTAGLLRLKEWK